ncbi:ABC-2 type transport system ATP-binding protein [Haloactinospora alba]|uniref:ABC-2 type transport system ATP-binding protein n=1 Tax=Haloactinospora alba TaxID=405555 RepID=A0A543NHT0_9ACTN|nr:ABC transporter ATP-binding protein [Haloactinospora alba]TQN31393.1 ABC-2 type transport system ATP-binding protein [Haloactinospora alba]
MDTAAVEVADMVKSYGSTSAVSGLSLTAARGAVTALLGPNGAGKTSTVEVCEGYRRADSGRVRVLGLDPVAHARALKPRVGVMLQSGGVPTGARTGEWLRLMASFHSRPVPADVLLERLGLASAAGTQYRNLSGGQKQRLAMAAAVIGRPELVFLDEPTAGLDPQARHASWELITELRAAGVGVLLTTHHMEEAERLADRIVIIDHGRAVAEGTTAELTDARQEVRFRATRELDTEALRSALPSPGHVAALDDGGADGCQYVVTTADSAAPGPAFLAAVTNWCAANAILPEGLRVQQRTLEDVFLELTGRDLRDS